ncbi:MAG TPA: MBL fold metallo-hydrolase [Acidobacteriota bacterium]
MKRLLPCLAALVFFISPGMPSSSAARAGQTGVFQDIFTAPLADNEAAFVFLGSSAVIVRTAKGAVIIDPDALLFEEDMDIFRGKKMDVVLYTHGHGDHFDYKTAVGLAKATGAPVCGGGEVTRALRRGGAIPAGQIKDFGAGRPLTLGAWTITPVRGLHVGPILLYQLSAGGIGIFHGGDSAYVPLKNLAAGLAFLPTGSASPTASPADGLKMAQDLKSRVVVAIHGSDAQNQELTKKIKSAMPATKVIIPETMKVYTVKAR